jgi:hypothetical protein
MNGPILGLDVGGSDDDFEVVATFVRGEQVHTREGKAWR